MWLLGSSGYSAQLAGLLGLPRAAIDGLFKLLQTPSAYDAPRYRAQMKKLSTALENAGIH